ncbi:V-type ATP synthase subunit I, partial [Hydrocoleum sp. CS-953]|uniref:V-type ATP synthase subunit I n=2 Tax=Oscillatoriales TaxID=1150 RepID=UPI001AEFE577
SRMSIITLNKVTVFGLGIDKPKVLEGLQTLGCMHLIPLQPPPKETEFGSSDRYEDAQKALQYIMDVPRRRHQVRDEAQFDLDQFLVEVQVNKQNQREAEDKHLFLTNRLKNLEPWGNFTLPDLDELSGYQLWFYQVPHTKAKHIREIELPWQIVGEDHLNVYLVIIAKEEPPSNVLPVPRTRAGSVSPEELQRQLEQVEIELDEIRAEQEALSRWIFLLSKNLVRAEDQAVLQEASGQTKEEDGFFLVQGWMPKRNLKQLELFSEREGLAFLAEPPQPDETPPTLMENPPTLKGGEALVTFYETPGYRTWDPSTIVFFSFALFFAMILADAGYALLLWVGLIYFWKGMGQSASGRSTRIYAVVILTASVIYGVMVGSYFGVAPAKGSLLAPLNVLNLQNFDGMMQLSIAIGCLHLAFANAVVAYRAIGFPDKAKPIGWISVIFGGFTWVILGWQNLAIGLLAGGFFVVFLGAILGSSQKFPLRLVDGFGALTEITKLFGDVLSYLRLFALGLASGSLAVTFNTLAQQVMEGMPMLGLLVGLLILLLGHSINLGMAILACFVHGVRLNVIEFFNWGLSEEGYPFHAFTKKEHS